MRWVIAHYTASDISAANYLIRIANNLPEVVHALDLARDALHALGVDSVIPCTRIWVADADFDWHCKYLRISRKKIQIRDRGWTTKRNTAAQKKLQDSVPGADTHEGATESALIDAEEAAPATGEQQEGDLGSKTPSPCTTRLSPLQTLARSSTTFSTTASADHAGSTSLTDASSQCSALPRHL